jgi:hypothetical protein
MDKIRRPLAGRRRTIAVAGLSLAVLGTLAFVLSAAASPDPASPAIETSLKAAIGDVFGAATFGPVNLKQAVLLPPLLRRCMRPSINDSHRT